MYGRGRLQAMAIAGAKRSILESSRHHAFNERGGSVLMQWPGDPFGATWLWVTVNVADHCCRVLRAV
jgi:hypothetical protein